MKEARYFYVPGAASTDCLPQEEATHAIRVLRLKGGDEIFLMDGEGTFYKAVVTMVSNKHLMYSIEEALPQERTWRGRIHIAMAPTKMLDRVEWFAEKATEIGFDELSMLDCRFSERRQVRCDRLEKIIISAVKQSRKAWMPKVNEMLSFKEFITQPRPGRKFICHCYEEFEKVDFMNYLRDTLRNTPATKNDNALGIPADEDVTVLIGPEGDFSIDEVKLALDNGYISASLGTSRLRTETAALMAAAISNLNLRL